MSQGQVTACQSNRNVTAGIPTPPQTLDGAVNDAAGYVSFSNEIVALASGIRMRLMGPYPQDACDPKPDRPLPMLETLNQSHRELGRNLRDIRDLLQAINAGLG